MVFHNASSANNRLEPHISIPVIPNVEPSGNLYAQQSNDSSIFRASSRTRCESLEIFLRGISPLLKKFAFRKAKDFRANDRRYRDIHALYEL